MKSKTRIKCLCCNELHDVDRRNAGRQKFCAKPACRKASKAASQRKWNAKEENKDYFKGPENVARVRAWRVATPGYFRNRKPHGPKGEIALQETLAAQPVDIERIETNLAQEATDALQDSCLARNPVFVGLVAVLSGLALQEDIASFSRKLLSRGEDILRIPPRGPPHKQDNETQNHTVPGASAACASPVQLD